LPKKYVDLCIVTKCGLKTLEKRLKKRGYKKQKIRENLDCEIFDICLNEAKEKGHNIKIIDTTAGIDIAKIKI
jgi:adenylate kinase